MKRFTFLNKPAVAAIVIGFTLIAGFVFLGLFLKYNSIWFGLAAVWLIIHGLSVYPWTRNAHKQHQVEESLRESQRMLQMVLDTIPARVFWKDLNSEYLGCNRLFAKDGGLKDPGEIIGMSDYQLGWRDQAELYRSDDIKVMSTEKPKLNYEEPQTSPEGKELWLRTSKIPLRDLNGKVIGVLGTYEDITERKLAEIALHESLQTSADIVSSIPSGLLIFHHQCPDKLILVEANPEAEFLTGIQLDEWRGREFNEVMPAAEKGGLTRAFLDVMKTGDTYITENQTYKDNRIDGSFRIRAFRMPGDRLGVAFENITERTRAYEALRESEERYRFLYKNLPIMLISMNADGELINVSRQWLATFGYARAEVLGKKITGFQASDTGRHKENDILSELRRAGSIKDEHVQLIKKNGDRVDVLVSAIPQNTNDGKLVRYHAILINISKIKQAEKSIRKFFRAVEQSTGIDW